MAVVRLEHADFDDASLPATVLATMTHPRDVAKRNALIGSIVAEALARLADDHPTMEVPLSLVSIARRAQSFAGAATEAAVPAIAPMKKARPGDAEPVHGGWIAGAILLICHALHARGNAIGSGAATRVLAKNFRGLKGASEANIKATWEKYSPVAHLWAAWIVCGYGPFGKQDPATIRFLVLAEKLLYDGVRLRPMRASSCLLDVCEAERFLVPPDLIDSIAGESMSWSFPPEWETWLSN